MRRSELYAFDSTGFQGAEVGEDKKKAKAEDDDLGRYLNELRQDRLRRESRRKLEIIAAGALAIAGIVYLIAKK